MLIAHLQLPELGQVVEHREGDDGGQVAPHWPGVGKLGCEIFDYVVKYVVNQSERFNRFLWLTM